MTYLDSLSFAETCQLFFYVFGFSTIVRYGFHFADLALKNYKWFFSSFGKSCRFWIVKGFRFLIVHFQARKKKDR